CTPCRAARQPASRWRCARSARREGAASVHAARRRGGAPGPGVDPPGARGRARDGGDRLLPLGVPRLTPWALACARGGRAVLAVPAPPPRRADDAGDRAAHQHHGRQLRVARRRARAGPARRSDGRARVEYHGRLPVRRDAVGCPHAQGASAPDRRGTALPRAVPPRQRREPAPRAACARPAARPVGAPRGGRADPRTGGARPRAGGTAYAARAAGPRRGARGAVGPAAALPRRAGAESGVTRLALEEVTFWYPATRAPALREVSLEVAAGEIVALVGKVGAGASTLLLVAAGLAPRGAG